MSRFLPAAIVARTPAVEQALLASQIVRVDVPIPTAEQLEDTRSEDIDPVDAVRMRRMGSWRGRCRRAAHATNRQHHAADHRVIG